MGIPVEIEVIVEVAQAGSRKATPKKPARSRAAAKKVSAGKRRR